MWLRIPLRNTHAFTRNDLHENDPKRTLTASHLNAFLGNNTTKGRSTLVDRLKNVNIEVCIDIDNVNRYSVNEHR